MTYEEFIAYHVKFLKEHPEYADKQVIFASDEEGNSFHPVTNKPSAGKYEETYPNGGDWQPFGEGKYYTQEVNAICIN